MPDDLVSILKAARESGEGATGPNDYVIPKSPQGDRAARGALQQRDLALNRSKAMEAVRDLRWGSGFVENAPKAHTGFEPVPPP